jgi:parallel beta-helix repeat protein
MNARVFGSILRSAGICFAQALILLLPIVAAPSAWGATYYVATTGNDTNAGTSIDLPFRTIQRAMTKAVAGDTVLVRGGTYREQVEANVAGTATSAINVLAYGTELPIIKGSDVVTGWTQHSGAIWKKTGWSNNSQQVFVDFDVKPGKPLQQIGMPSQYYTTAEYNKPVGAGLADMTAGTFYYDAAALTLYVWLADGSDPNKHVMEASVRRRLFFMRQPYIHLKGFAFRHSNSSAFTQLGAAVELSSNSVIEVCDIQYTDFAGLAMGYLQDNSHVYNCNISNNGDSGINASGTTNFWVTNVTMNNNNYRNFNPLWHAGGFKAATQAYGVIEYSEVGYNNGSGIWFDYANSSGQIVIRNNYVHDNGPVDSAIFFEVSNNGLIYNNVLVNNRRRGIYLSAANNARVYNNTIVGTSDRAAIEVAGMPRGTATLTNNMIYNNIISNSTSLYDLYIMPDNGTSITNNKSDYNDFYRAAGSISLWSGSQYSDLTSWRNATKLDINSRNANPNFVAATTPPSALNYAVTTGSPVIDAGANLSSVVPNDYVKVPRPAGAAFDIGAFEAVSSTTSTTGGTTSTTGGTTDTTPPVVTINSSVSSNVKGSFKISASATDNVAVTGMRLYIDNALKATSTTGQITYQWKNITIGTHQVLVTATDAAQNTGSTTATLTVR